MKIIGILRSYDRRLLQWKRHIKIKLCVRLNVLRLFQVGHLVQIKRTALSRAWQEWFSCKGKEWKIYGCDLALSSEPQIWKLHVVVLQTTSKHFTKKRAARAARLFLLIQLIKSLVRGPRAAYSIRNQSEASWSLDTIRLASIFILNLDNTVRWWDRAKW